MSKGTRSATSLISQLEAWRAKFPEEDCPTLQSEKSRYEAMLRLITKTKTQILEYPSRGAQWRRGRARLLLLEIGSIGAEVFFLCTQATTLSQLAEFDQREATTAVRTWWSSASCPSSLTRVAKELWDTYSLDRIVPTQRNNSTPTGAESDSGR